MHKTHFLVQVIVGLETGRASEHPRPRLAHPDVAPD